MAATIAFLPRAFLLVACVAAAALAPGSKIEKGMCVTNFNGEPVVRVAGCDADCIPQQCGLCRCRGCAACHCGSVDPSSGMMPSDSVCGHIAMMGNDWFLGRASSAEECNRMCDSYYNPLQGSTMHDGRVILGRLMAECTIWTLEEGLCVGHTDSGMIQPGDATRADKGVATCAPEGAVQAAKRASEGREAPFFAMVHTVASMAVTPSLAARMARARAQFSGTPHLYRVAQVSRTCHSAQFLSPICKCAAAPRTTRHSAPP